MRTVTVCCVLATAAVLACGSDRPVEERCFPEHPGGEPDPDLPVCGLGYSDPELDAAAAGFQDVVFASVCDEVSDPAECNRCEGDAIEARLTEQVMGLGECLREKGVQFSTGCVWMPEDSPSGKCCYQGAFFTPCVYDSSS